ncbi:MAG TPA: arsinothricin resistance N-acetyltransferase ArsN1 family B [Planctomycetota bacterium]|nr:arsinothricin resistance N-acetyltransferase ArsN1 family B [Planctomycetota bacterium]
MSELRAAGPLAVRVARGDDAGSVAAIYAPVVRETAISFELEPPDEPAMRRRIEETLAVRPWLVCERDGELLGYAYAAMHRERAAYQWCVETSVYIAAAARRQGVGRALYAALLPLLARQGYVHAYAGITLPNAASVGLHETLGFRPIGVYRRIGFKLGAWHDVGWWDLTLPGSGLPARPAAPVPFPLVGRGEPA